MWCNNDSSVGGDILAVKQNLAWVASNFEIIFQNWFWHWFKGENKDWWLSPHSLLLVGVPGPGWSCRKRVEATNALQKTASSAPQNTRQVCPPEFAFYQSWPHMLLQKLLPAPQKSWLPRLLCLQQRLTEAHTSVPASRCWTSRRYHLCSFASWVTVLWHHVSTLWATGVGWLSVHFDPVHLGDPNHRANQKL